MRKNSNSKAISTPKLFGNLHHKRLLKVLEDQQIVIAIWLTVFTPRKNSKLATKHHL